MLTQQGRHAAARIDALVALVVGAAWFGVFAVLSATSWWMPVWSSTHIWAGVWLVGALGLRTTAPLAAFWSTVLLYPVFQRVGLQSYFHVLPLAVAAFAVMQAGRLRWWLASLAAGASGLAFMLRGPAQIAPGGSLLPLGGVTFVGDLSTLMVIEALVLGAVALGVALRRLDLSQGELRARNADLELLQHVRAEQAVTAERNRISREMHDLVAHHVSAIIVRAQAAVRVAPAQPEAPAEALTWIAGEGKEALTAMRSMVRVLKVDAGDDPPAADGIESQLVQSVDRLEAAGRTVDLRAQFPLPQMSRETELALVRIAQEAMTNVLLHSGATSVHVSLATDAAAAHLRVADPGPRLDDAGVDGFGVLHMTERASSCGGALLAGPDGAGWVVVARLPVVAA